MRDSVIFSIHGTVVANTDSWVFLYLYYYMHFAYSSHIS